MIELIREKKTVSTLNRNTNNGIVTEYSYNKSESWNDISASRPACEYLTFVEAVGFADP